MSRNGQRPFRVLDCLPQGTSVIISEAAADDQNTTANEQIATEQAASLLHYNGGNDRMRVEIAPDQSQQLRWKPYGCLHGRRTDIEAAGRGRNNLAHLRRPATSRQILVNGKTGPREVGSKRSYAKARHKSIPEPEMSFLALFGSASGNRKPLLKV